LAASINFPVRKGKIIEAPDDRKRKIIPMMKVPR
jgi:hypothetical protein